MVEEEVVAAFDRTNPQRLADLGGISFVEGRAETLARVSLMPEILEFVLDSMAQGENHPALRCFVVACALVPVSDDGGVTCGSYKDAIEAIANAAVDEELAAECQDILTRRAENLSEPEPVRWIALGAALQFAITFPDLHLDLLRILYRLKRGGHLGHHPEFARRAAKVSGVAYAYWPEQRLKELLEDLCTVDLARDEALFELGMARLREGLDTDSTPGADACFEDARSHFDGCLLAREHRPDALAYSTALSMLTSLRRGDGSEVLASKAAEISKELHVSGAWSEPLKPTWKWMGARWTELLRWRDLAGRLSDIADNATAAADPKTELGIRHRLLGTYVANRAALARGPGGVETFIQPAIEARLLRTDVQYTALTDWLSNEMGDDVSPWKEAAGSLLKKLQQNGPPVGKSMRAAAQVA